MKEFIKQLSEAPDDQLATPLAEECKQHSLKETTKKDDITFVRNLLDKCIRYAGASSFVVSLLETILKDHPEDTLEQATRRSDLLREEKK